MSNKVTKKATTYFGIFLAAEMIAVLLFTYFLLEKIVPFVPLIISYLIIDFTILVAFLIVLFKITKE